MQAIYLQCKVRDRKPRRPPKSTTHGCAQLRHADWVGSSGIYGSLVLVILKGFHNQTNQIIPVATGCKLVNATLSNKDVKLKFNPWFVH